MKKLLRICGTIYFTAFALLAMTVPAAAYIDPATTSYIIQIIAGVFIAAGVVIGVFWKKIRLYFRNLKMKRMEKQIAKEAERKQS
ncbi:hypothetical protein LJC55_03420 [Eubacteriales bacterium OttesenSCG-928-N14]|nr:hypothetical protein [Eubacteriales bacterium OttesenSCG-928-N14]